MPRHGPELGQCLQWACREQSLLESCRCHMYVVILYAGMGGKLPFVPNPCRFRDSRQEHMHLHGPNFGCLSSLYQMSNFYAVPTSITASVFSTVPSDLWSNKMTDWIPGER